MAQCPDGQETVLGVCPTSPTFDISCLPETDGMPAYTPANDQIPFAYDPVTGTMWLHSCPDGWIPYTLGLCTLPPVNINVINNLCDFLNIPVVFDNLGQCVQGTITLANLAAEISNCLNIQPNTSSVVVGSSDVSVTAVTVGSTTTYTVTSDASVMTSAVSGGHVIASHDDGNGTLVSIQETITSIVDNGDGTASFTNEAGNVITFQTGSLVQAGSGATVTGDGTPGTPYVVDVINSSTGLGVSSGSGIDLTATTVGLQTNYDLAFDACDLPSVNRADAQTLAACDGSGNSVRVPVYKEGSNISISNATGQVSAIIPPSMDIFDVPINILNLAIPRSAGTFDTGAVNVNINGVQAIPAGAVGVILRTATSVSGQFLSGGGNPDEIGFAWVHVSKLAGNIAAGNITSSGQDPLVTSYSDTDMFQQDNDNISYPLVELNGNTIAYRGVVRWLSTYGVDMGVVRIDLVGFYF